MVRIAYVMGGRRAMWTATSTALLVAYQYHGVHTQNRDPESIQFRLLYITLYPQLQKTDAWSSYQNLDHQKGSEA